MSRRISGFFHVSTAIEALYISGNRSGEHEREFPSVADQLSVRRFSSFTAAER